MVDSGLRGFNKLLHGFPRRIAIFVGVKMFEELAERNAGLQKVNPGQVGGGDYLGDRLSLGLHLLSHHYR